MTEPRRELNARDTAPDSAGAGRRGRRLLGAQLLGASLALGGVIVGAALVWRANRPVQPPSTFNDPLDDVLSFALIESDFQRLSLEQRLQIARDLAERLRTMDAEESAVLASFAAGVRDEARRRLTDNVRDLMFDVMDKHARDYASAPAERKEKILEESLIELFRLREQLNPLEQDDDRSAEEELERFKEQAQRRAERRAKQPFDRPKPDEVQRMFQRVESDMNEHTSPMRRARMVRYMRDAVRYLRGQDPTTGEPKH